MRYPTISYHISLPHPNSHYYHVTALFDGALPPTVRLTMPVWTPGSYLIREYARHLVNFTARSDGQALSVRRENKAEWSIDVPSDAQHLSITYQVYAYDLSVRTSYLDSEYGLIAGAGLFLYCQAWRDAPLTVTIAAPPGWDAATALQPVEGQPNQYRADSFDELVDSPIQLGRLVRHSFTVDGHPHHLIIGGPGSPAGDLPRPSFLDDLGRMVEAVRDAFDGLPYETYQFFVTLAEHNGGGLEHANSSNIMVARERWRSHDHYPQLLRLFAHEFFHAWNVKRLRPVQFRAFDYQSEVYTSLLWALEGLTDYFAEWLIAQSGAVPATAVLAHLAARFQDLERQPGRCVTALADSSREAWIRQYRPDANSANITISYYLKGALVGCLLDLEIRRVSEGRQSLLAVMQHLWRRYGDRGYPEGAFEQALIDIGGPPLDDLVERYVHGTDELDDSVFETVGMRLERGFQSSEGLSTVWLGIDPQEQSGRLFVRTVERGSAAEEAGVAPDDELLAVNRERVLSVGHWKRQLTGLPENVPITLYLSHQGLLREVVINAQPARPDRYEFLAVSQPSAAQKAAFQAWLGVPYPFSS